LCHSRESRVCVFKDEFSVSVLLPSGQHGLLVECEGTHRKLPFHGGRDMMSAGRKSFSAVGATWERWAATSPLGSQSRPESHASRKARCSAGWKTKGILGGAPGRIAGGRAQVVLRHIPCSDAKLRRQSARGTNEARLADIVPFAQRRRQPRF